MARGTESVAGQHQGEILAQALQVALAGAVGHRQPGPAGVLLWQKQQHLEDDDPLFCSRKKGTDGGKRAISRVQAWKIVKDASARMRQLVRQTKSLPLAQKQAG